MNASDVLLWVVVPYVCLALFAGGHVWRYRYDKFGWTTRSSQLYESRLLRLGSPLFHFGILFVLMGHVMGLGIPESWTEAVGVSEGLYHVFAVGIGGIAGFCTLVGMAILIYRRRTVGPVFSATTKMDKFMWLVLGTVVGMTLLIYRRRTVGPVFSATTKNDKVMYVFLAVTILSGLLTTVLTNLTGHGHDYRETVSPYFRSIFYVQPRPELMSLAPLGFQLHVMSAWLLFAIWPFTRLVHMFSAPLGYLTRPYVVYRSRDTRAGSRPVKQGWEPSETPVSHR